MAALNVIAKPVVASLALLALALPARAEGHFGLSVSVEKGGHDHPAAVATHVVVAPRRVWVAPVCRTLVERVWVPTVTTCYRDVPVVDIHGRVISYRREPYTVEGGHWENVTRQIVIHEGYWRVERHVEVGAMVHGR